MNEAYLWEKEATEAWRNHTAPVRVDRDVKGHVHFCFSAFVYFLDLGQFFDRTISAWPALLLGLRLNQTQKTFTLSHPGISILLDLNEKIKSPPACAVLQVQWHS